MSSPSKTCFVIMPFSDEFKNQWELALVPAIEKAGLVAWRDDDESLGTNIIINDVTECIYNAEIIIADLTGKNPNVMYELGLAHAAKKMVVILSQSDNDVPFDLRHIRYLKYDVKDLSTLKNDLYKRIKSTLLMTNNSYPEFFPELKIFNKEDYEELKYLRKKTPVISVSVEPNNADIFFNDRLLGTSPVEIRVNTEIDKNTISAVAPGCYEFHEDISQSQIDKKEIRIKLEESSNNSNYTKRVPRWLRFRRRDPNNPVLMRAIIQYLLRINEVEDTLSEVDELLKVAPEWYLAQNQAGYVKKRLINVDEGIKHYKKVTILNQNSHLGFYNLACCFSIKKDYKDCIEFLTKILSNEHLINSFTCTKGNIFEDEDFDNIKADKEFSPEFMWIGAKLMKCRKT